MTNLRDRDMGMRRPLHCGRRVVESAVFHDRWECTVCKTMVVSTRRPSDHARVCDQEGR